MNDDELSALIRSRATRHRAGERLRAAVRTQLALHAAAQQVAGKGRTGLLRLAAWRSALAGFAAGAALTLAAVVALPRLGWHETLPDELVAVHVRALRTGPLFDVASSDRHTVKPWFQGRLDYAPQVVDLAAEGFPLLGGRVDTLSGRPTAALAYLRQRHVIDVYVWPADGAAVPGRALQRRGFNLLHWSDASMQVWAVSDVEAGELERFGQAWRDHVAAR